MKLSADQIELTQHLYDAGEHTVVQVAGTLKVPRTTVYGHPNKRRKDSAPVAQQRRRGRRSTCPPISEVPDMRI
ncbi:hypothetical protein [Rhodococcus oxybenzonivorans]|uniref:hypothetical protein n=1 Tax=Rhodococcus oxybenzonivorans TaxID=1990687 RepID=UPI001E3E0601|nr:hypothetical protein [Rhodococcus oxybenzonivorans]